MFRTTPCLALAALLLATGCRAPQSVPAAPSLPAQFQALTQTLPREKFEQDGAPAAFVQQLWGLAAQWTVEVLRRQPTLDAAGLTQAMATLEPATGNPKRLEVSVLPLPAGDHPAFVVCLDWETLGTFFVVARDQGQWRLAWNMWEEGVRHFAARDEFGRWAYLDAGFHDGHLTASLHAVPATQSGHPRFLVRGGANPAMGGDWPAQISVWEWTGQVLQNQFIACGTYAIDYDWALKIDGHRVRVHTKEGLKSFWACGMCPELESIWTLDLSGDGVRDLGRAPVTRELALVDELVDRIRRGASTTDLAAPDVAKAFEAALPEDPKESLGMIGWSAEHRGPVEVFRFSSDELPPVELSFEQRDGRPFLVGLKPAR